jgi:hypothetical protein
VFRQPVLPAQGSSKDTSEKASPVNGTLVGVNGIFPPRICPRHLPIALKGDFQKKGLTMMIELLQLDYVQSFV